MRHTRLQITAEAESDLQEIWSYTINEWGKAQANRYLNELMEVCHQLVRTETSGKAILQAGANVYVCRCNRHFIYYLKRDGALIFIAFMHEKRDALRHVVARLP